RILSAKGVDIGSAETNHAHLQKDLARTRHGLFYFANARRTRVVDEKSLHGHRVPACIVNDTSSGSFRALRTRAKRPRPRKVLIVSSRPYGAAGRGLCALMGNAHLMKISLGSWAFVFGPYSDRPIAFDTISERLAKAGFDGIEIGGFPPHVTLEA